MASFGEGFVAGFNAVGGSKLFDAIRQRAEEERLQRETAQLFQTLNKNQYQDIQNYGNQVNELLASGYQPTQEELQAINDGATALQEQIPQDIQQSPSLTIFEQIKQMPYDERLGKGIVLFQQATGKPPSAQQLQLFNLLNDQIEKAKQIDEQYKARLFNQKMAEEKLALAKQDFGLRKQSTLFNIGAKKDALEMQKRKLLFDQIEKQREEEETARLAMSIMRDYGLPESMAYAMAKNPQMMKELLNGKNVIQNIGDGKIVVFNRLGKPIGVYDFSKYNKQNTSKQDFVFPQEKAIYYHELAKKAKDPEEKAKYETEAKKYEMMSSNDNGRYDKWVNVQSNIYAPIDDDVETIAWNTQGSMFRYIFGGKTDAKRNIQDLSSKAPVATRTIIKAMELGDSATSLGGSIMNLGRKGIAKVGELLGMKEPPEWFLKNGVEDIVQDPLGVNRLIPTKQVIDATKMLDNGKYAKLIEQYKNAKTEKEKYQIAQKLREHETYLAKNFLGTGEDILRKASKAGFYKGYSDDPIMAGIAELARNPKKYGFGNSYDALKFVTALTFFGAETIGNGVVK